MKKITLIFCLLVASSAMAYNPLRMSMDSINAVVDEASLAMQAFDSIRSISEENSLIYNVETRIGCSLKLRIHLEELDFSGMDPAEIPTGNPSIERVELVSFHQVSEDGRACNRARERHPALEITQ